MNLTLVIHLGNDAMRTPDDLAEALRRAASRIQAGYGNGKIRDINGNYAGTYDIA